MASASLRGTVVVLAVALCLALTSASPRGLRQATTKPAAKPAAALALPGSNALCVGPTAPARIRYQWAYEMKDPTPANIKAMDALVKEWMKMCEPVSGGGVVRYGQGAAITKKPSDLGYKAAPPPTAVLADYGAWSDWRSLDDIAKCYKVAVESGITAKIRVYAKSAARTVLDMSTITGNTKQKCASANSIAPAGARYMVFYVLADDSAAGAAKVNGLFGQISALTPLWIRRGVGRNLAVDPTIFGPTVKSTANYGLFRDFAKMEDVAKDLGDPATSGLVAQLRALSKSSMRIVIPLTAA